MPTALVPKTAIVLLPALLALLPSPRLAGAAEESFVWWEGEKPTETNFPARSWFSPQNAGEAEKLSGGAWLTSDGKRTGAEVFARYQVTLAKAGEYALWTRKFYKHGPFRWRFDAREWQTCGKDVALADSVTLRTHVCANWVYLGKVKLPAGKHTFELRLLAGPGESKTACFDCFVLARGPFAPNGKRKPGERSGQADEGRFASEPALDSFSDTALLDLRSLNEVTAGASGFVRADGMDFRLGNGKKVRFWAVNVSAQHAGQDRASVDYLARKLAKLGVNMVRFHSPLFDRKARDPARVDAKALDNLHYLVAAMKKQGIYTKVSFYFPLWFEIKPTYGIAGYDTIRNKKPFALLFFEPRMQQIHRSWARALLTTPNPYTKMPLARDPAVAIVEIVNEDSYFFWTFGAKNVPAVYWRKLEGLFGQWAAKRYGSADKALSAWGRARHKDDNPSAGVLGLYDAWHMTAGGVRQGGADKRRRVGDQVRFLAENQRAFFAETTRYFKKDLGYRGLVSATNWHTADPVLLDALERYTYTACDVIDRHGYFGGPHKGQGANYSVRTGHTFSNLAGTTVPQRLPIRVHQHEGHPHIISELGWTQPNLYRADCTFLASAYGALQGTDGMFFFAVGTNTVSDLSMRKFQLGCPTIAGTFPAAALAYRRGDVQEAPDAVRQVLRLEDLYAMKGSGAMTDQALDKLREADIPAGGKQTGAISELDPLSFYVGRVVRTLGEDPNKSTQRDLSKYIDRRAKTVRSLTGQLAWDFGRGVATMDTPRTQGVCGRLAEAPATKLGCVTIDAKNDYGSILVTSLDDTPLADSKKILIQAMTDDRPLGFRERGGRITQLGAAPFGVTRIRARVTLRLAPSGSAKATALDENGYPTSKPVALRADGTTLRVNLPADALYVIVQR